MERDLPISVYRPRFRIMDPKRLHRLLGNKQLEIRREIAMADKEPVDRSPQALEIMRPPGVHRPRRPMRGIGDGAPERPNALGIPMDPVDADHHQSGDRHALPERPVEEAILNIGEVVALAWKLNEPFTVVVPICRFPNPSIINGEVSPAWSSTRNEL
jgi:hypothetical protein